MSVKGKAVGEAGTGVSLGIGVSVYGKAVSVSGSVGYGVAVLPGNGALGWDGVRVAILGTQRTSPVWIKSLLRQLTAFNNPAVV